MTVEPFWTQINEMTLQLDGQVAAYGRRRSSRRANSDSG